MIGRWLAAALAVVAAGCGGGIAAGSEEPYDFAFDDPAGDTTAAVANPDSVRAIDLVAVSGTMDRNRLTIVLTFAEPVVRWSDGATNSLDGFLYLDIDQSTASGRGNRGSPRVVGADFYVDFRDNGSGRMALVDVARSTISLLSPRFDGVTVTFEIPRSAITTNADADNVLHLFIEVDGRNRTPISDIAPDEDVYVLEPPEAP